MLCLRVGLCVFVSVCLFACVPCHYVFYSIDVPSSPQERLKALTDIVWPEIALLIKEQIQQARDQGTVLR